MRQDKILEILKPTNAPKRRGCRIDIYPQGGDMYEFQINSKLVATMHFPTRAEAVDEANRRGAKLNKPYEVNIYD
jgi:hypothetical protein